MSKTITFIEQIIESYKGRIKKTFYDERQVRDNVYYTYMLNPLSKHLNIIETHHSYIGKEVRKYSNSFKYGDENTKQDSLNTLEGNSVVFTQELFDNFLCDLFYFFIDRCTDRMLTETIVDNSSCPFSNLYHKIRLEATQELVNTYRELLRLSKQ